MKSIPVKPTIHAANPGVRLGRPAGVRRWGGRCPPQVAFSLVEVVLALGIVSFAVFALLGALSIGIVSVQESMRQTVYSHILRQVSSDLDMLPLSDLPAYVGQTQYFSYDGARLQGSSDSIFVARLIQNPANYPGLTNAPDASGILRTVSVDIRRTAEPEGRSFRATVSTFNRAGH